jgi:hypothetical protein
MVSIIGFDQLNEQMKKKYIYKQRERNVMICLSILPTVSLLISIGLIQYDIHMIRMLKNGHHISSMDLLFVNM